MNQEDVKKEVAELEGKLTALMLFELAKFGDKTPRGKAASEIVTRILDLEKQAGLRPA